MSTNEQLLLSTKDNPFNPFTQFDDWYRFDIDHHYYTTSYLARIAQIPVGASDAEQNAEINRACKEIMRLNLTGNYIIVKAPKDYLKLYSTEDDATEPKEPLEPDNDSKDP